MDTYWIPDKVLKRTKRVGSLYRQIRPEVSKKNCFNHPGSRSSSPKGSQLQPEMVTKLVVVLIAIAVATAIAIATYGYRYIPLLLLHLLLLLLLQLPCNFDRARALQRFTLQACITPFELLQRYAKLCNVPMKAIEAAIQLAFC